MGSGQRRAKCDLADFQEDCEELDRKRVYVLF